MTRNRLLPEFSAIAAACLGLAGGTTAASLAVPFGNHMVLQRGMPIPVWGTGTSGEAVTVTLNGQTKSATTSSSGKWTVTFDAMVAGGPFTLTAKGTSTATLTDVMIGEVWQCAGQSNMDTRMNYSEYPSLADSIKNANHPLLRYITMRQPGQTIQWQQVTPTTVGGLSATGYFMGREILDHLNGVAVGLVVTAVGGTTISQWMDPASIAADPTLVADTTSGTMYDAWVKPVVGYAIAGTAWYQGENDCTGGRQASYAARLPVLIRAWRRLWGQGDFPFLVAQLAHVHGMQTVAGGTSNYATLREAQRTVSDTMAKTWLSVNIDLGDSTTLHYDQKPEAGRRLGLLARGGVYNQAITGEWRAPEPVAAWVSGSTARIVLNRRGTGWKYDAGTTPTGFAIAGSNGTWYWGTATARGDTIDVSSSSVTAPTQVRHAWSDDPVRNLRNAAGLPVAPFLVVLDKAPPTTGVASSAATRGWTRVPGGIRIQLPTGLDRADLEIRSPQGRSLGHQTGRAVDGEVQFQLPRGLGVVAWQVRSGDRVLVSGKEVLP
jgi:sialate O-acetylesterase